MNILRITLLLLSGAAIQTLLPPWAFAGNLEWPVLTALLIYISLRANGSSLIYAALLTGLLYDSFSPAPLGTAMPFFLLLGAGLYLLRDEVFADQLISYVIIGAAALLLKTAYFAVIFAAGGLRPLRPGLLAGRLGGDLVFGALIVPLVYLTLAALRHAVPAAGRRRRT